MWVRGCSCQCLNLFFAAMLGIKFKLGTVGSLVLNIRFNPPPQKKESYMVGPLLVCFVASGPLIICYNKLSNRKGAPVYWCVLYLPLLTLY